jgi:hypothetical protein
MSKESIFNTNRSAEVAIITAGVVALSALAYVKLKPERSKDRGENYFDIIDDLDSRIVLGIGEEVGYVVVGGGACAALMDPRTQYDLDRRLIIAPEGIRKDQFRANGTMADIDIVVFIDEESVIEEAKSSLTPNQEIIQGEDEELSKIELSKPGAKLKIGITGLMPESEYDEPPATRIEYLINTIKKDWVSQRLLNGDSSRFFAISDIKIELPDEYFEPWHIELNSGKTIPVLHPLLQVLCYPSRASHGIRPRDKSKVIDIMNNIGDIFGARLVWGDNGRTANLVVDELSNPGIRAAIEFCEQKNALRWINTKERLSKKEAAILAARIAIHRQLDTRKIFIQFGQGGWLYDNVVSRFSRESQGSTKSH